MKTMIMSAMAAIGLFTFSGTSLMAQNESKKSDDCCTTKTDSCCGKSEDSCSWSMVYDGKRTHRINHCVQDSKTQMPTTVRIEVKPEDRQVGDVEGVKYVGKRTERVYFRDIERKADATKDATCSGSKEGCNYMFVTVGKHTERRSFCEHNNQQVMCGNKAGECATCRK